MRPPAGTGLRCGHFRPPTADLPAFLVHPPHAPGRRACFLVSVLYNIVGLSLALTGALTPLAAAVLMPVSSLSVIGLSVGVTRRLAHGAAAMSVVILLIAAGGPSQSAFSSPSSGPSRAASSMTRARPGTDAVRRRLVRSAIHTPRVHTMLTSVADSPVTSGRQAPARRRYPRFDEFAYDNGIVQKFALATAAWGVVAFIAGLTIALKLIFPGLPRRLAALSYGRLRPLHTNAAIFAFGGNAIFVGVYYSLQRLCKARMFSDRLSALHFWGWQLIIVAAAITLPLGFTTSKEYAELEWPIDVAHHARVGRVRRELVRHDLRAPRAAPLCRDLVLHGDVHHGRGPAHRQLA